MKLSKYFIMLGKVFEWACHETDEEVGMSSVKYINGECKLHPNFMEKRGLCLGTILDSMELYDNEHDTNFKEQFQQVRIDAVEEGIAMEDDINHHTGSTKEVFTVDLLELDIEDYVIKKLFDSINNEIVRHNGTDKVYCGDIMEITISCEYKPENK